MRSLNKEEVFIKYVLSTVLCLSLLILSCQDDINPVSSGGMSSTAKLMQVDDFLYQLQNIDLAAIGNTEYDLVVMDYSADGQASGEWSYKQIRTLQASKGKKILLAYISIGEAEDYRYYWDAGWSPTSPDWLGQENPDWPGNYKVKYWQSGWQDIIFDYLDKIIDQGFDGIYMDIIDGYWYWVHEATTNGENEQLASDEIAANKMINFIKNIADYCHKTKGKKNFILCPQNGSSLINDASSEKLSVLWDTIDAIGVEDTFYYGDEDEDNDYDPQDSVMEDLEEFIAHGKKVLATDYLSQGNQKDIHNFYYQCLKNLYTGFATDRDLDVLRINAGHVPD